MAVTSEQVVWTGLGLFNLGLALLLVRARPLRLPNVLAAVIMGGNAFFAFLEVIVRFQDGTPFKQQLIMSANTPTLFALAVLPFVFPRRVLRPTLERLVLGAAAALTVANWALIYAPGVTVRNDPLDPVLGLTAFLPFFVALSVGTFVLLHTFLAVPSPIEREQAKFLLTAYLLKIVAYLTVLWAEFAFRGGPAPALENPYGRVFIAILAATFAGVLIGLAASRLRRQDAGVPVRTWGADAFVVLLALSALPAFALGIGDAEYMLIRPLLLTYGILRFQMLDVEAHARSRLLVACVIVGLGAVFAYVALKTEALGVSSGVATGVAFATTLGLAVLFAWPLLSILAAASGGGRSEELYRAALEETAASRTAGSTTGDPVLRALRSRLNIGEREHAAMEASAEVLFGRRGSEVAVGRTVFGRYSVTRFLGEGGFARTFLAQDQQMHRTVVLKAARTASAKEAERVLHEARMIAKLRHPHVVIIHDVEQVGGDCFLVLEYMEGGSVADKLRDGPLPVTGAVAVIVQILEALEAAHHAGIVHRDVKPANILLDRRGAAKLADFGIARASEAAATAGGLSLGAAHPGSLAYMSPEQIRGRPLDARSDLYSLAATAYEMLAGRPYVDLEGRTDFDARIRLLKAGPPPPIPGIPAGINALLRQALSKDPERRPPSAAAMRQQLQRAARAASRPRRPGK